MYGSAREGRKKNVEIRQLLGFELVILMIKNGRCWAIGSDIVWRWRLMELGGRQCRNDIFVARLY